jgi:chromatin structure-remodeling complex subunit RSC1/2
VRIKNWNSCIPEEVRQKEEFMPIYPFERTVYPVKLPSPFLVKGTATKPAVKGPGGLLSGSNHDQAEGPSEGRRSHHRQDVSSRAASSTPHAQPAATSVTAHYPQLFPHYAGYVPQQVLQIGRVGGPDRSVVSAAGGVAAIGGPAQVEKLPSETGIIWLSSH